jgi:hypothetical protein
MAESGDQLPNEDKSEDSDTVDDELKRLQVEEDALAKRMEAEVSEELSLHMAKLELELKLTFDERMSAIQQQCKSQVAQVIDTRQTDILRTNKVFRDVSRALGTNWQPVFEELMSRFSPELRLSEMAKIKAERPILQAYKALMTWKDACGAEFDVRQLVDALRHNGLENLVEMTLQILNSNEKDSLITFSGFGTSGKSVQSLGDGPAPTASGRMVGLTTKSSVMSVTQASTPSASSSCPRVSAEDALDDRHILQLAKRLAADWEKLAGQIGVPGDEIAEILAAEGRTYQGAFKMLWAFRESASNLTQAYHNLLAALVHLGRQDIVDQVFGP